MKILVPTDFNKASFSAYRYASMLSEQLGAEVTLLHVIAGSFNTGDTLSFEPLQTMETTAYERLQYFATTYADDQEIDLTQRASQTVVRWGIPGFSIVDYARDKDFDLIVIGSRDNYGFLDRLLGSASAVVVRRSECPVLVIHADTPIQLPEVSVFAFDDKGDIEDAVEDYRDFNNPIGAFTKFLHVDDNDGADDISRQIGDIIVELADEDEAQFAFTIDNKLGNDIPQIIKDYCLFEKADLLAIHRKEDGIFRRLFGSTLSVTLAQGVKLPVLVV